jgi:hypothetical protein
MPAPKVNELTTSVEQVQLLGLEVLNWRYEQLEDAGWPTDLAIMLAERGEVDLHEATGLLEQGCPLQLALLILT